MQRSGDVVDLYTAAFDALTIGAALVDAEGVVVSVNAAWRGVAPDVQGKHCREALAELIDAAEARDVATALEAVLRGTRLLHRAEVRLRASRPVRWIDLRLARLVGPGRPEARKGPSPLGRGPGVLVTVEDVTGARRQRDVAHDAEGLRESEATLRAILDALPDVVFRMRRDGALVELPDAVARSTRGQRGLMATLAEQSAMYATQALATRTPKGGICHLTTAGSSRDYETRLVPYGEDEALVIARDITDQTRTEEELQLFLAITLTTSEAPDLRAALTVVLRQICESTGWLAGAAWMPGNRGTLECDAVWVARETAELHAFRESCRARTLGPGEALAGKVWTLGRAAWVGDFGSLGDAAARAATVAGFKTGFAVPVLSGSELVAILEFYASESRGEDERLLTMVSAVAEQLGALMKRKRVEESVRLQRQQIDAARLELQRALETAARQWRITFDAIESPIFLLDRDVQIVRVNRAAKSLAAADYKEQLGRGLETVGSGEPWQTGAATARASLHTRASTSAQARDEVRKQTWDFAATLIDDEGDERVILVVREITRLVELQESLRHSETLSAMGTLVAGVAHEVRNPLHAITVTLDAFEARFRVAEHASHIHVLRGEVARLTALMRELLEYGKPAASRLYLGQIADVVAQSTSVCAREAQEREVTVQRSIDPALPAVLIDPERLVQVMTNVLQNAIQYSNRGGRVTIAARPAQGDGAPGAWVECTISDEGPGFREGELARVFEPFFTRRKGGTGLGLSIVQRIVDMHRGRVWASNRAPSEGVGGVITIRLPVPDAGAYDSRAGA